MFTAEVSLDTPTHACPARVSRDTPTHACSVLWSYPPHICNSPPPAGPSHRFTPFCSIRKAYDTCDRGTGHLEPSPVLSFSCRWHFHCCDRIKHHRICEPCLYSFSGHWIPRLVLTWLLWILQDKQDCAGISIASWLRFSQAQTQKWKGWIKWKLASTVLT